MCVIIICSYIFVYETRLKKFMNYKFSDKVSGLQASAIREILKFTADPEVISFAAGNLRRRLSLQKKLHVFQQIF